MPDFLEENLLTYIRGPKGEAAVYEAFQEDTEGSSVAVLTPLPDGSWQKLRLVYVVRLKESVQETYPSLGEAYIAAGNLVGVEAGFGFRPGQHLAE